MSEKCGNCYLKELLREAKVDNFTARELTWANRWQSEQVISRVQALNLSKVAKIAQEIRNIWGKPVVVVSGFRSQAYNDLVEGAPSSRHLRGMAIDMMPANGDVENFKEVVLDYFDKSDKLLGLGVYSSFCHIDYGDRKTKTRFL